MSVSSVEDFFDEYAGEGGPGAPSFWFDKIGATVKGTVVSTKVTDQTMYKSNPPKPIPDPKRPGQNKKQIVVVLDTPLRNWEGIKNKPTLEDGVTLKPADQDTGARAIYVKGWMIGAVADAVKEATNGARKGIIPGDKLAVKLSEQVDTGQGNPLNKFVARAEPAPVGADLFEQAEEEQAAKATEAPAAATFDDEEPPF